MRVTSIRAHGNLQSCLLELFRGKQNKLFSAIFFYVFSLGRWSRNENWLESIPCRWFDVIYVKRRFGKSWRKWVIEILNGEENSMIFYVKIQYIELVFKLLLWYKNYTFLVFEMMCSFLEKQGTFKCKNFKFYEKKILREKILREKQTSLKQISLKIRKKSSISVWRRHTKFHRSIHCVGSIDRRL